MSIEVSKIFSIERVLGCMLGKDQSLTSAQLIELDYLESGGRDTDTHSVSLPLRKSVKTDRNFLLAFSKRNEPYPSLGTIKTVNLPLFRPPGISLKERFQQKGYLPYKEKSNNTDDAVITTRLF